MKTLKMLHQRYKCEDCFFDHKKGIIIFVVGDDDNVLIKQIFYMNFRTLKWLRSFLIVTNSPEMKYSSRLETLVALDSSLIVSYRLLPFPREQWTLITQHHFSGLEWLDNERRIVVGDEASNFQIYEYCSQKLEKKFSYEPFKGVRPKILERSGFQQFFASHGNCICLYDWSEGTRLKTVYLPTAGGGLLSYLPQTGRLISYLKVPLQIQNGKYDHHFYSMDEGSEECRKVYSVMQNEEKIGFLVDPVKEALYIEYSSKSVLMDLQKDNVISEEAPVRGLTRQNLIFLESKNNRAMFFSFGLEGFRLNLKQYSS